MPATRREVGFVAMLGALTLVALWVAACGAGTSRLPRGGRARLAHPPVVNGSRARCLLPPYAPAARARAHEAATCEGYRFSRAVFCGCVAGECAWYTQ